MTEIAELEKIEYALVNLKYKYAKEIDPRSKFADAILDFWNLDQGEHRFQIHARVFKGMDLAHYIYEATSGR